MGRLGGVKEAGERIIELIRRPPVKWGEVARGATDAGINPLIQATASEFFKRQLTKKKKNGGYEITRVDIHTAIRNGILLDELIDEGNPSPWLVDVIRVFDIIPFVNLRDNLERVKVIISDGRVMSQAIQECRPDLWSVVLSIPGYGEKWIAESAQGIIQKLINVTEGSQ